VVILVAAVIVAGTNWMSLRSLREEFKNPAGPRGAATTPAHKPVIALMPKRKVIRISSVVAGPMEAAKELGVELFVDGPTDLDPAKQNEMVEAWINEGRRCHRREC